MSRGTVCTTSFGAALALLALLSTSNLSAQDADDLAGQCAAAGGDATMCAVGAGAGCENLVAEAGLHFAVPKFLEGAAHLCAIPQVLFSRWRFGQLLSEEEDEIVEAFG